MPHSLERHRPRLLRFIFRRAAPSQLMPETARILNLFAPPFASGFDHQQEAEGYRPKRKHNEVIVSGSVTLISFRYTF
jgi:hypothetical protein